MKEVVTDIEEIKSTLEKHYADLIDKLESLDLSKKDHDMAMNYMEKGEKMAYNVSKDPAKLDYFVTALEKANSTEDVMVALTTLFKKEFIASEGRSQANEKLDALCKSLDSKEAREKLQECDKDTRGAILKMTEILSSKRQL